MKQELIQQLLAKIKSDPKFFRKIKIIAVIGVVTVVVSGGLLIWAGVAATQFAVAAVSKYDVSTKIQQLQLQPLGCLEKAQKLLTVQPWLEHTVIANLHGLKVSCFEAPRNETDSGKDKANATN